MKTSFPCLARPLAVLLLALCSWAAQAEALRVSLASNFVLPPLTAGPSTLRLDFNLTEPLTGVISEGPTSFRLENISIDAVFNGSAVTSTANLAGWFSEPDFGYHGIDVRLSNLLVPGDVLQMIFVTPMVLFSVPASAPTLDRLSLSGLSGGIYYYPTGSGGFTSDGPLSNASYSVSAVPEPHAAGLLSLGLLGLVGLVLRRRMTPRP